MNVSSVPITRRTHPPGADGAKVSLEAVAARIRADYLDELVIAFARKTIAEAGGPRGVKAKAEALLAAQKKRAPYVLDPVNAEVIVSARHVLCLDPAEAKLCMRGGDCDEQTATFCALAMAVGIDCIAIGQSFSSSKTPTHVLAAVFDPQTEKWLKVDPSSPFPVGQAYPATHEVEVDPLTGLVPDFDGPQPAASFVGIGSPGLPPRPLRRSHVGSRLGETQAEQVAAFGQQTLVSAVAGLYNAYFELNGAYAQVKATRSQLRPATPYDPPDPSITSLATLPSKPVFTQTIDSLVQSLLSTMLQMTVVGQEAIAGSRSVYFDPRVQDFFISAKASDPWKLISLANPLAAGQSAAKTILGFFTNTSAVTALNSLDVGGNFVPAATVAAALAASPLSQTPTAAQVALLDTTANTPIPNTSLAGLPRRFAGVGLAPVVIGLIVVGAIVVSIALYYSIKAIASTVTTYLQEVTNQDTIACIASGKCPPELGVALQKTRQIDAQTSAEIAKNDPFANVAKSASSLVGSLVFGAVVIGGFILAKEVVDRYHPAPKRVST